VEEEQKEECKILSMEDYDWAELGLSQAFTNILNKKDKFEFKVPENADKAELEWRPAVRRTVEWGDEVYQGQWIKGTMIKQGFGRRSWLNLRPKYRGDHATYEWFDQGYFA